MAIGLPGSGSGGLINFMSVTADSKVGAAVFCGIAMVGWFVDALFGFWLWNEVHRYTKRGGHSLQNARAQAVTMGLQL
jgi:hypothetical protein